ncbi:thylakoid lumenal 15.0 kDa protein [Chloropicon primus]|nr:thylakoid lumenal 15.0 kDa protein [Chloropicon primus]
MGAKGMGAKGMGASVKPLLCKGRPKGARYVAQSARGEGGEASGRVRLEGEFDWKGRVFRAAAGFLASSVVGLCAHGGLIAAEARLEGVNKPELLPKEYTPLIDVADFLTSGEEQRVVKTLERLERDTGVKLRVLAQNYPETPGLAIKDFWKVDASTVVLVADPNTGNITNFNVGEDVDIQVPRNFWSKVAGKFGNKFYWQDQGADRAIINSVNAIDFCVREPESRLKCTKLSSLEEEF